MRLFYLMAICFVLLAGGCDKPPSNTKPTPVAGITLTTNPFLSADGERVTLKADNLTQHQILSTMAAQLSFELKTSEPLDKTISVNLTNVTLREALQTILSGNPYSVTLLYQSQVDFFPKLVTVVLNSKPALTVPTTPPNSLPPTNTTSITPTSSQDQAIKQFQEKMLVNGSSPAIETTLLQGMTGTKEDAVRVMPMLTDSKTSNDDKEAIIDMLQNGSHDDVIEPLKTALQDQNPDVVKAAIEAIVFLGDQRDVETLRKLRDSTQNDDIRQAADDGLTFLE